MPDTASDLEKDFLGCLPELPEVAAKFVDLTRELNTSKKSYANLLLSDPILSSRIFSYINYVHSASGAGGFLSINKGVSLMGLHKFKNLVVAFSLFPAFQEADCVELYKYSLLTAYYSKDIASRFNLINPHDAFLLGFLHDIGKLALKNKFGDKYRITRFKTDELEHEYSIEDEITGFNYSHADISEYICKIWNLPIVVADAIKFHHFPLDAMLPQAASIIFLSDMLAHQNMKMTKITQKVFQYMQLSKSELAPYTTGCERKLMPFFEILGIN